MHCPIALLPQSAGMFSFLLPEWNGTVSILSTKKIMVLSNYEQRHFRYIASNCFLIRKVVEFFCSNVLCILISFRACPFYCLVTFLIVTEQETSKASDVNEEVRMRLLSD